MVIPRQPRPRPVPLTPEEAAEIEAKYDELCAFVQRMTADFEAQERERERREAP